MPFQKGHLGNKRLVANTLRRLAKQNPDKLRRACEVLLDKAVEGDLQAFSIIAERLDGKATQIIEATVNHTVSTGDAAELASRLGPTAKTVGRTVQ